MDAPSNSRPDTAVTREQIIGLDEQSLRKSYFPQLQLQIVQLSEAQTALEQKAAALRTTNRSLRMIGECSRAMVHADDEAGLLAAICRIVVEHGGYRMAWVGFAEQDEARSVRPVAQWGFEEGYLNTVNITWADAERGRGPVGTAIRTGSPCLARNIPTDPAFSPWRAAAIQRGYASSIALPLLGDNRVCFGALMIYAAKPDAFIAEEVTLLTGLAGNLAYGITSLRTRDERNRAETARRESDARIRNLFEQASDGIFAISADNRYLDANPRGLEMLGYAREELLRMGVADVLVPRERPRLAIESVAMMAGKPHLAEWMHRRKDGSTFSGEVSSRRLDETSYLAIVRDLTERQRADAALRESEARLSMALEVAGAGIWEWNLKSDEVRLDARLHALLGYAPGELPTTLKEWLSYNHPDDVPTWMAKAQAYLRGDSPLYESEHRIRNKAGTWSWVLTRGKLVSPTDGDAPEQIIGIAINITERKQAEETLRRTNERLRLFIDANIVGVVIASPSGGVIEANDYYLRMIGYAREEFERGVVDWRAITPSEWLPADERAIEELRERGICSPYEKEYVRRDGTRVSAFLSDAMLPGPEEEIAAFVLDITDRKRAEEALSLARDELEQRVRDRTAQLAAKNEELKAFAYTVSHDLKAPLRGIAGYASELARKHRAGLSERAQFCINQILTATRNQDRLIEDLLHYSRLDTETPSLGKVDLLDVVQVILRDRALAIAELRVEVSLDIPFATLQTWERGLAQVLTNLIDNAVKYSRKSVPPRLGIRAEELEHGWRLAVSDNGIGFDMKYRDRIFGLFNRLVREDEFEGTGAGLAIVKKILDRLGGRIWAESEVGKGATFFVELPKVAER